MTGGGKRTRRATGTDADQQHFHELVDDLGAIVWESDPGRQLTYVSRRAELLLGYPSASWHRRGFWAERLHPDDRERTVHAADEAVADAHDHELEYRLVASDGGVLWLRDIVRVVVDERGRPAKLRGVMVDITQTRQAEERLHWAEEQLRHSQKMEAVGLLAGGIAHDFNNLLTVISGFAALLSDHIGPEDTGRAALDEISRAAQVASGLTRQLLAFSRKQIMEMAVVDLNQVVREMQTMLSPLLGEHIQLASRLEPTGARVRADLSQVKQMVMNLAVNARDAMPSGGILTIEVRALSVGPATGGPATDAPADLPPGDYRAISVSDSGHGMSDQVRSRIFEPFYTTKEQGKGTGLGLSTVYGIVKQLGGYIAVQSSLGSGASFHIFLPAAEGVPERLEEPPPPVALGGTETLLVVEDSAQVRAYIVQSLKRRGYAVLEAPGAIEALEIVARDPARIQLVVTDVVMPEMRGTELAKRLAVQFPRVRVMFVSGYTDQDLAREGLDGRPFLQKPFTPEVLAAQVRAVLDAKEP